MTRLEGPRAFTTPSRAPNGVTRRTVKTAKRWLYLFHRWLGVATCVLCVMWFLSGLVMLYVPFPNWSDQERIAALPTVDTARVNVTPDVALAKAGTNIYPTAFRLEMLGGTPVYRIVAGGKHVVISAETGDEIGSVSAEDAALHLFKVFPGVSHRLVETLDHDQWTVTRRYDAHRPLYRFAIDDGRGTIVYVSSQTGEIVQNVTRPERFWNWLGAIPHWIYFTPIRRDQQLWRQSVMWLSGPLVIGAITGLWIGILRLRVRQPYKGGRVTPYRGWMKWHHIGGLVGGIFLTTWIFSGWLSVNPFQMFARTQVTQEQRTDYAGWTPVSTSGVTSEALNAVGRLQPTDISFSWVGGQPFMIARNHNTVALAEAKTGATTRIENEFLLEAARHVRPENQIVETEVLTHEDVYWYSHHRQRPLPVIRAVFDDPAATWVFLDPATGAIAGLSDTSGRTYRWLFNFFHDYDLPILLRNQPARDIIVWLLSIAGMVISVSGIVIGWRTLKRSAKRSRPHGYEGRNAG